MNKKNKYDKNVKVLPCQTNNAIRKGKIMIEKEKKEFIKEESEQTKFLKI